MIKVSYMIYIYPVHKKFNVNRFDLSLIILCKKIFTGYTIHYYL